MFERWPNRVLMLAAVPRPTDGSAMMRVLEDAFSERLSPEAAARRVQTILRGPLELDRR